LRELEGYEVLARTSPVSFFARRTTRAACLIGDQNMPKMTGLSLLPVASLALPDVLPPQRYLAMA
jgi:FixJ family two-component response regulator